MAHSRNIEDRRQVRGEQVRSEQLRGQQVRGLLLLAVAALLFAVLRAGVSNVFSLGWWRAW